MFFSFMGIIFPLFFALIFGMILFTLVRGISEWSSNNNEPVLTVIGKVVGKRTNNTVSNHVGADNIHHAHTDTTYYATFEVESGDRMEFRLKGKEFGMLAEGDIGKLTFQGTRYHGFERIRED